MRQYRNFEFEQDLFDDEPGSNLGIAAVIPAYDEPYILKTIESIASANPVPEISAELIVVINDSDKSPQAVIDQNKKSFAELQEYALHLEEHPFLKLFPAYVSKQPSKEAGVGLARKIGMDEAVKRMAVAGRLSSGIICSLDADILLEANYFNEVWKAYQSDNRLRAANVFFEHKLDSDYGQDVIEAIVQYECHLRYHIQMQRLIGLPYAFHTIGSAMTVTARAYMTHFGMNRRQAGEDFYFLHKFIKSGFFREINTTTVYPDARFSDRVPFGTGHVVGKLSRSGQTLKTYNPESYLNLKLLTGGLSLLYQNPEELFEILPEETRAFLGRSFIEKVHGIKTHTSNFESFKKRFFQWFDAFMLIKYLHHCRDNHFENIPVALATDQLLTLKGMGSKHSTLKDKLLILRALDRVYPKT
jgi:hypothetical protein